MIREFNSLEEVEKYYDTETNTYIFKENEEYIDLIVFDFDLNVDANIDAGNIIARDIGAYNINAWNINASDINARDINSWGINAWNINAGDIKDETLISNNIYAHDIETNDINAFEIKVHNISALDINAYDIKANKISYYGVCFAYNNIKCKSIKGRRKNSKHFVLDGKLEVEE